MWLETSFGIGTEALRCMLNDGTGALGTPRTISTVPRGGDDGALALLDVDGDGDLDIVATGVLFDVLVFRNLGNATFAPPLTHRVGGVVTALAGGDFDRDGDVDLVTNTGTQSSLQISRNRGDGTFEAPFTEASARGVTAIVVADLDGDGILDLCAGYALDGDGATTLAGRGDGTFRPFRAYHGTYSGMTDDIAAVDLDREAWLDLLTANHTSQDVSFWRARGDGTFERLRRYGVGQPARALAQTDVDGGGVPDLAVQVEPDSPVNGWYYPALVVLRGKSRGFADLGHAVAGTAGAPALVGFGPLAGGQPFTLELTRAAPSSACAFAIGAARIDFPFAGGAVVPRPDVVFGVGSDAGGRALLTLPWPVAVAAGTAVYFQAWILDPGAPLGLAASNGLSVTRL